MPDSVLTAAVTDERMPKRLLQRLFAVWFDAFVYNQIWEDPQVDLQALALNKDSRVLTISSGGCNALNYLLLSPRKVTAVDLNRSHLALLRLKAAAIEHLPSYERFFAFFGAGRGPSTNADYLRYIAPHLDNDTRAFCESNTLLGSLVYGDRISFFRDRGIYDHSRSGYFLRAFHRYCMLRGYSPEKVLAARSLAEQKQIFDECVAPFFNDPLVRAVGKLPFTLFSLGIPPQQHEELSEELGPGETLIDVYRARVRRLACDFPVADNYFAWQAFARRYDVADRRALPEYLKEENFTRLRSNIGRLETRLGSATEVIRSSAADAFDRFVFLDAQDWMDHETLTDLWTAVAEKASPGARIIFRTAGSRSPVETKLPDELRERFVYEKELSENLSTQDRAAIYGGFHLYVMK